MRLLNQLNSCKVTEIQNALVRKKDKGSILQLTLVSGVLRPWFASQKEKDAIRINQIPINNSSAQKICFYLLICWLSINWPNIMQENADISTVMFVNSPVIRFIWLFNSKEPRRKNLKMASENTRACILNFLLLACYCAIMYYSAQVGPSRFGSISLYLRGYSVTRSAEPCDWTLESLKLRWSLLQIPKSDPCLTLG